MTMSALDPRAWNDVSCGEGGPSACALRRKWAHYAADRWMRSLPAGVFPRTMYQEPTPRPVGRCSSCPRRKSNVRAIK